MEKSFDKRVVQAKQEIIQKLNELNLPISVMAYVIKDVAQLIESELNHVLSQPDEETEVADKE